MPSCRSALPCGLELRRLRQLGAGDGAADVARLSRSICSSSTSTTTSAFALSLASMIFSAMRHLVGGVADGDGVERLEREDVARLDHRADDVGDLLGVAVREIEGADDEILVVAAGLRVVGDDDDGVLVEHLVEVIGGLHHALERLLRGDVLQLDGDAVVLDRLIEEDVDAEGVAEGAVDVLDRRLAREGERDRLVRGRVELRRLGLGDVGAASSSRRSTLCCPAAGCAS